MPFALFSGNVAAIYCMEALSFREFVQMRERLLPPFRIAVPTTKISPFPATQARLKRTAPKPVKAPNPFEPTVQKVADVVPPLPFRPARGSSGGL